MELSTPNELDIVMRFASDREAETAYVLAIKRLIHATDINTAICTQISSTFNEIRTTMSESEIFDLGKEYGDVFSRTLFFDLKNLACKDLLNTRHDGLSEAHTNWVNPAIDTQWFSEKTTSMEKLTNLYAVDITQKTQVLDALQILKAQVWLAASHSKMVQDNLGMR